MWKGGGIEVLFRRQWLVTCVIHSSGEGLSYGFLTPSSLGVAHLDAAGEGSAQQGGSEERVEGPVGVRVEQDLLGGLFCTITREEKLALGRNGSLASVEKRGE